MLNVGRMQLEKFKSKEIGYHTNWSQVISEDVFESVDCYFNGKERKVFCIVSSLWVKNGCITIRQSQVQRGQPSTSTGKPNTYRSRWCSALFGIRGGVGVGGAVIYSELVKCGQTLTVNHYRQQLMQLNCEVKAKWLEYFRRHDKVIF